MKKLLYMILLLFLIFLAAPYFIVRILDPIEGDMQAPVLVIPASETPSPIPLVQADLSITDICDFERYLIGVVAAEVPALFHFEAIRAQAVASRTYAVYSMAAVGMDEFDYSRIHEIWQAYLTEAEMRRRWGDNFDTHFATISEAVISTRGEIMVYNDEPIVAVFHAFSGGMTEYSEKVWREARPYLRSVNSDFYMHREDFEYRHKFSGNEFMVLLREEFPNITFGGGDIANQILINERSNAGYVLRVTVGSQNMEGSRLRRILGLRSTNFTVYRELDKIVFRVRGHGHGAGMSQVGANALAQRGYSYVEILKHYYSGITLERRL